ncbi:MAG: pilin [bacterium]
MNTKKITKLITAIGLMSMVMMPMMASAAIDWGQDDIGDVGGLSNSDPRQMASGIIQIVLSFLGIIAVAVILIGGFKWMTAGGNDDKVTEGRKWIVSGIIGLAIVLAAWGIATFVIEQLIDVTTP